MPPSHPLDIPEILARIGLFLPLWVDSYNNISTPTSEQRTYFKPRTFLTCALVSKTWRQAFLPLLWHRYDCTLMKFVPQETVAINSPHFRVLQIFGNDATAFQCVDLVDLTIKGAPHQMLLGILIAARSSRIGAGARAGCEGGVIVLSPQQQLVRSNLYLQSLFWHGPSPLKSLDVNDFTGLKYIQTLKLSNWLCSPKTMVELLSLLVGTLREFNLDKINGLQPLPSENLDAFTEKLSTLFTPQPDKDGGTNNSNHQLVLPRLTNLVSTCDNAVSLFLAELVKSSPRLRSLVVYLADDNGTRLADDLNRHCPELQELKLSPIVTFRRVDALIRQSSAVGLRKLSVEVCGPDEDLVAAILQHAGTLEDLAIERSVGDMNICRYFNLLEECSNLESFSLSATAVTLDKEFLDTLKSNGSGGGGGGGGSSGHRWKCRWRLRKLVLNPRLYLGGGGEQLKADKDLLIVMSDSVSAMGWYRPWHPDPQQHFRGHFINHTMVRKTFELVQGLEKLETLVLDTVMFRSSPTVGPVQLD